MTDNICDADGDCNPILSATQKDVGADQGISDEMPDTLGTRLRRLRIEKKLSQLAIANEIDASQHHISGLESGSQRPSIDLLAKLAKFHGTTIDFLLFGIPPQDALMNLIKDPETRWLVKIFQDASPDMRDKILAMTKLFASE